MQKKIFITATGTDIGKTYITTSLCKTLHKWSENFIALKPIISGFSADKLPNDISEICAASGIEYSPQTIEQISLYRYTAPLSPDMAAAENYGSDETPEADFNLVKSFVNSKENETILIEGAGGVMAPLNSVYTNLDLISHLNPNKVVLVCGSYLGSISHTLSALAVLKSKYNGKIIIVVNQNLQPYFQIYIDINKTLNTLQKFTDEKIICINHSDEEIFKKLNEILL